MAEEAELAGGGEAGDAGADDEHARALGGGSQQRRRQRRRRGAVDVTVGGEEAVGVRQQLEVPDADRAARPLHAAAASRIER